MPTPVRRKPANGGRRRGAAGAGGMTGSVGAGRGALVVRHRRPLRDRCRAGPACGHLEEQLLEVARGAREADDRAVRRRPTRRGAGQPPHRRRGTRARWCRRPGSSPRRRPDRPRTRHAPPSSASPSSSRRTRRTAPNRSRSLDVRDATLGEDLAVIDDRDARAQLLELGEDVAADDDRLAHRAELAEELAQLDPGARVEARCGLIEEQDLRIVDEGVGQAQPLLHAARERLDVGVALVRRDRPGRAGRRSSADAAGRVKPVAAGEEVEVLPDLHVVVDPERRPA